MANPELSLTPDETLVVMSACISVIAMHTAGDLDNIPGSNDALRSLKSAIQKLAQLMGMTPEELHYFAAEVAGCPDPEVARRLSKEGGN